MYKGLREHDQKRLVVGSHVNELWHVHGIVFEDGDGSILSACEFVG